VGAVLDYANAAPYTAIAIWEAHRQREFDAALDWQRRSARAAALVTDQYGIPGLKYAMDLNGYYGGPVRLPLTTRAGSEAGDRGGVPGSEGLRRGARSRMGKKKEIIEIKIDRLKLMRIRGRRRGSFMRPRKRRPSVSASRSISRRPGTGSLA